MGSLVELTHLETMHMNDRALVTLFTLFAAASSGCLATEEPSSGVTVALSSCETDSDCDVGQECEVEHGAGLCKAHGGDEGAAGSAAVSGDDSGNDGSDDALPDDSGHDGSDDALPDDSGHDGSDDSVEAPQVAAVACASDADCAAGEECELEHGTALCKAHGGGSDDD